MGQFALPAAYGLTMGGAVTEGIGANLTAKAEAKAARFNAEVVRRESSQQLEKIYEDQRRQESRNIVAIAKSGVRVTGSPLDVLNENVRQTERAASMVKQRAALETELLESRAKFARKTGRFQIASSAIGGAGRIGQLAVMTS